MSEKEFLVDAVAQFIQSSVWLDAVSEFLDTHYRKFFVCDASNGTKYEELDANASTADDTTGGDDDAKFTTQSHSLEQFDTFMLFKDLVERLLEQVIADLGCSGDDLVSVLEASVRLGKHASVERQFFLQTLLSFESYSAFHRKISAFAAEKLASGAVMLDTKETVDNTKTVEENSMTPEYAEWILQLAIARSILESNERGELDATEEALVSWAAALVAMNDHNSCTDVDTKPTATDSESTPDDAADAKDHDESAATSTPANDHMHELEQTLIRERLKVDLLVAQRTADANAQRKQQLLHLVATEHNDDNTRQSEVATKSDATTADFESETELAALLAQFETIASRLALVKTQCFAFTRVEQSTLDSMYLFLKEKVHFQHDLAAHEHAIGDFVFAHIDAQDAALVPLLLEWLLLEAEGLRVQHAIQDQLGSATTNNDVDGTYGGDDDNSNSSTSGYWNQHWDDTSSAFYYVHSTTHESSWDAPLGGYVDTNAQFVAPAWDGYDVPLLSGSAADTTSDSDASVLAESVEEVADSSAAVEPTQSALDEAASQLDATLQQQQTRGGDTSQLLEFEAIMRRISQEHDDERERLELLYQIERARQHEELRKRKDKKRRERLAKTKAKSNAGDATESKHESTDSHSAVAIQRAPPPPPLISPRLAAPSRAETKDSHSRNIADPPHAPLSINVPGHGRIDLTHLLSDTDATRFQRRSAQLQPLPLPAAIAAQTMVTPSTLRYLTDKLITKDPTKWHLRSPQNDIVIDESDDADAFVADHK